METTKVNLTKSQNKTTDKTDVEPFFHSKFGHIDLSEINIDKKENNSSFFENSQLSELTINSDGIAPKKRYSLLNEYASRIIEINDYEVIAECITDIEEKVIETRHYSIGLFKGLPDLKQGRLFFIQILQGDLERVIKIIGESNNRIKDEDFDLQIPENILKGIDFSTFNKY